MERKNDYVPTISYTINSFLIRLAVLEYRNSSAMTDSKLDKNLDVFHTFLIEHMLQPSLKDSH